MIDARLVRPASAVAAACAAAGIAVTVVLDLDPTDDRLHLLVGVFAAISLVLLVAALVPRSGVRLPLAIAGAATSYTLLLAFFRPADEPGAPTIDLTAVLYVALGSVSIVCTLVATRLAPGPGATDVPGEDRRSSH